MLLLLQILLGNRQIYHLKLHPKDLVLDDLSRLSKIFKLIALLVLLPSLGLGHLYDYGRGLLGR